MNDYKQQGHHICHSLSNCNRPKYKRYEQKLPSITYFIMWVAPSSLLNPSLSRKTTLPGEGPLSPARVTEGRPQLDACARHGRSSVAALPLARHAHSLTRTRTCFAFFPRIFEEKRDCSQSNCYLQFSCFLLVLSWTVTVFPTVIYIVFPEGILDAGRNIDYHAKCKSSLATVAFWN